MLTLKKNKRDEEIHVHFRDRELLFDRTFLLALILALAFHGFALLAFHIKPFKLWYSEQVFPPVLVEAEIFNSKELNQLITEEINTKQGNYLSFLAPPPTVPILPTI